MTDPTENVPEQSKRALSERLGLRTFLPTTAEEYGDWMADEADVVIFTWETGDLADAVNKLEFAVAAYRNWRGDPGV